MLFHQEIYNCPLKGLPLYLGPPLYLIFLQLPRKMGGGRTDNEYSTLISITLKSCYWCIHISTHLCIVKVSSAWDFAKRWFFGILANLDTFWKCFGTPEGHKIILITLKCILSLSCIGKFLFWHSFQIFDPRVISGRQNC